MAHLGRFSVSASLLAALLALPCVCSAAEPDACHVLAESAYQLAVAHNDPLPDGAYEQTMGYCQTLMWRAFMVADPSVSLNELVAFDQAND